MALKGTDFKSLFSGPRFVRWIIKIFRKWGFIISDHAWPIIIICLLISSLAMLKIISTRSKIGTSFFLRLRFSGKPTTSLDTPRMVLELTTNMMSIKSFSQLKVRKYLLRHNELICLGLPVTAYLFIVAKDNGSMIRPDYLEEAVEVKNILN